MSEAGLQVLVIEDSEDDFELLQFAVRRAGLRVIWGRVSTAEEMRAALQRQRWDLIISDFTLPAFSAVEAVAIARNHAEVTPLIVLTGTPEAAAGRLSPEAPPIIAKGEWKRLTQAIQRLVGSSAPGGLRGELAPG